MSFELISFASAIRSQIMKAYIQIDLNTDDYARLDQLSLAMADRAKAHIASKIPAAQWHDEYLTELQTTAAEMALILAPYYFDSPLAMEQTPVGWLGEVPEALELLREAYRQQRQRTQSGDDSR